MIKLAIPILISILLFSILNDANGQSENSNRNKTAKAKFISLSGQVLKKGNKIEKDGNIHEINSAGILIIRTRSKSPKGTVLLIPDENNGILILKNEAEKNAQFLQKEGYDVAILEYHVASGLHTKNLALMDAMKAYRLIKSNFKNFGICGDRFMMMGFTSGGNLAARTVQKLGIKEQPENLILISPSNMDETLMGTVFPAIMPPLKPKSLFLANYSSNNNPENLKACQEYVKTWIGYDGLANYKLLSDSTLIKGIDGKTELEEVLKSYLNVKPESKITKPNPAAIAVEGYSPERHAEKLALISKEKYDLIMIGNSITNNFEKPEYQPVWNKFFAPRKALNLGYSGYRTENLIWNIQNGELEGQNPKVVVLEIGTNNVDEKNYPTRHTAGQLAGGIEEIVKLLRQKLPETKIIVLRCFPGCYGGPNPTSHRAILERASDLVSKLADGKHIFYCDVNHVFLNLDGSINHEMMPDWLHPSPDGAKAWTQAMEPLLSELMGDKSRDNEIPANSAIVPVSKLENDSYDWWARHSEVLRIKDSIDPEIVLVGNSITHFWGGEPKLKNVDGTPRIPNGPLAWDSLFHNYRVLNLGFGWDRTQNVLWRLDHGELDGLHPGKLIINIGTNNTSQTENARMNSALEILEGIQTICMRVRSKLPETKIILMAIFPREQSAKNPRRMLINEINEQLEIFAREQKITFVNIGPKMLAADGSFLPGMTSDFCHPTEKGYQIWADGIRDLIAEP